MSFETWKENFNREKIRLGTYYKECWNDAQAEMREPGPCGHPKMFWAVTKTPYPSIPSSMKNPLVFIDANLGICCVAEWPEKQWVFKIVNNQWVSVREVGPLDPSMVVPLPESGYCTICEEIRLALPAVEAEMREAFSKGCDEFHRNGSKCVTCGRLDLDAVTAVEAERKELVEALTKYFRELDSPVKDTAMILMRREQLRTALARVKGE